MKEPNRTTPPAIRHIEKLTIANTRTMTLDNGMTLNILDRGQNEVNRLIALRAGGMAEASETDTAAVASLTSELLREGTVTACGASMAEVLEYNGAWIQAVAHSHHITLSMSSINSCFDNVAPIMADMWSAPSFPEGPLEVTREAVARQVEQAMRKVSYKADCAANRLVMGASHPLARPSTPEEIRAVDSAALRRFFDRVSTASPTELFLSGRITPAMEDTVNRTFGQLPTVAPGNPVIDIRPFSPASTRVRKDIRVEDSLQSAICLSIPVIPRTHPDYIDLRIAIVALGGYFGSRLMTNIREDKGYTYGIYANLIGYLDGSTVRIGSECDNAYTPLLLEEIDREIDGLATRPADPQEMDRLRQYLSTSLLSIIETPFTSMDYYITMRLVGTPHDYFARQLEAINTFTPETIAEMAKRYLRPDLVSTVVAGA